MDPVERSNLEIKASIIQNKLFQFCKNEASINGVDTNNQDYLIECFDRMQKTLKIVNSTIKQS